MGREGEIGQRRFEEISTRLSLSLMARWILSREHGKCSGGSGMPFWPWQPAANMHQRLPPRSPHANVAFCERSASEFLPGPLHHFTPHYLTSRMPARQVTPCGRAAFQRIRGTVCVTTSACVVLFGYGDSVQAFSLSKYFSATCVWTATWNRTDWDREVKSLAELSSIRLKIRSLDFCNVFFWGLCSNSIWGNCSRNP